MKYKKFYGDWELAECQNNLFGENLTFVHSLFDYTLEISYIHDRNIYKLDSLYDSSRTVLLDSNSFKKGSNRLQTVLYMIDATLEEYDSQEQTTKVEDKKQNNDSDFSKIIEALYNQVEINSNLDIEVFLFNSVLFKICLKDINKRKVRKNITKELRIFKCALGLIKYHKWIEGYLGVMLNNAVVLDRKIALDKEDIFRIIKEVKEEV